MAVECRLGNGRKIRFAVAVAIFLIFGGWSAYDGWFNEQYWSKEKEGDRLFNQVAGIGCGLVLVVTLVRLAGAVRTRVVADETGIDVNGKFKIAWMDLTKADDSKYDKGLVRLYYRKGGQEGEYLVDSYMINKFDDLLDEISRHRPDVLPPVGGEEAGPGRGTDQKEGK